MRRTISNSGLFFSLIALVLLAEACGGGGGGVATTSGVTYKGNASQAVLNDSSAEAVAVEAYSNGESGGNISGIMDSMPMDGGVPGPAMLTASVSKAVGGAFNGNVPRYTQSSSMNGICGGNASFSAGINEQTGDFSFSIHFNSYCDTNGITETVLNGAVGFKGKINMATEEPESMAISFVALSASLSDGSEDVTISGSLDMIMTGASSGTTTMNFVTRDNIMGKTYWVDNYVASMTDYGDHEVVTIVSGRFYHHDHGYVDVSTVTPLQIYPMDEHPSAGVLQFNGADGSSARLTFLTATTYQVAAELNGDGLFDDFVSEVKTWQ